MCNLKRCEARVFEGEEVFGELGGLDFAQLHIDSSTQGVFHFPAFEGERIFSESKFSKTIQF